MTVPFSGRALATAVCFSDALTSDPTLPGPQLESGLPLCSNRTGKLALHRRSVKVVCCEHKFVSLLLITFWA